MSTNKTTNLLLHDWAGPDRVLREEINENFRDLDSVIGGHTAQLADIANARNVTKYDVKNDGTDTTTALNALTAGYTYVFPAGTYAVNGYNTGAASYQGFVPKSNTRYIFLPGAKIKIITNGYTHYTGIYINQVDNVEIQNVVIEGDRDTHDYSSGGTHEWGHGILIYKGCGKIVIEDPYIYDTTGDGIDIISEVESDISIINPVIDNVRRNGIAVESVNRLYIRNPKVTNINGTNPQSCIDIEPFDPATHILTDICIENGELSGQVGHGLMFAGIEKIQGLYNIRISNLKTDGIYFTSIAENTKGHITINNPIITGGSRTIAVDRAYPNAFINQPIIHPTINVANSPAALYVYSAESGKTCGGINVIDAEVPNLQSEAATYSLMNFSMMSDNTVKDMNITFKKSNLTNVLYFGSFRNFTNVDIQHPKAKYSLSSDWWNTNGTGIIRRQITNGSATGDINVEIFNSAITCNINEMEILVEKPYKITVGSTGIPIQPFGFTSIWSNKVGSRIKLKYDNVNNVWTISELVGEWNTQRSISGTAMPTSGTYVQGDYVKNTAPTVVGSTPNRYTIKGWIRITSGTAHVLWTDWVEDKVKE